MLNLGTKIYRYDEDENIIVYRIVDYIGEDGYKAVRINGKKKIVELADDVIMKEYIALEPDAFMNILITSDTQGGKIKPVYDVLVCIHKPQPDNKDLDPYPDAIIRQNCYSSSKNSFNLAPGSKIYVGDSIIKYENNLKEIKQFMQYEKIESCLSFVLYVDDTVNEVLQIIPPGALKATDTILNNLKKSNKEATVTGYSETFKDFLVDNNFMNVYRSIFNIIQVNFVIKDAKDDEPIELNPKQIKILEDILCKKIQVKGILKYDKDIDVGKIVQHTHMMISDSNGTIYLVVYAVIADYAIDQDILNAFNLSNIKV